MDFRSLILTSLCLFSCTPLCCDEAHPSLFSDGNVVLDSINYDEPDTHEWDLYLPNRLEDFQGPRLLKEKILAYEPTPPFFDNPRKEEKEAWNREKISNPTPQEFEINLKNPVFSHGVITTTEGGVVSAEGIRIQARNIEYTNRVENGIAVQKIIADGDLLIEYGGNAFVGQRLEFDFLTRTGVLYDGRTFSGIWFLGGEKIELKDDGSYLIYNAYITTCESQDRDWEIHTGMIQITKDRLLTANNIQFRFIKIPLFWLPKFKSNLKLSKDTPIRYKLRWDKGLGPRLSMRYRVFSNEDTKIYFRFDYRLSRGPGAALEGEYYSPDDRTIFLTKNYAAYDKEESDEHGNKRYRLQGLFHTSSKDQKTQVHAVYDKLSDDQMPGDFKSDDFEINTQKRTLLLIDHNEENLLTRFRLQPRINRFQSLNQELPLIFAGARPFTLGNSGILFHNMINLGYLDYIFRDKFDDLIRNQHAFRLETQQLLYRPIPIQRLILTPHVGFTGIFYNNSPEKKSAGQAIGTYGFLAQTFFSRRFDTFKHMVEPYINFQGYTHPTVRVDRYFIFNIDDGYNTLNLMKVGIRNTFFRNVRSLFSPRFMIDLFSTAYFDDRTYNKTFPKTYLNMSWSHPSYALYGNFAWNQEEQVLDYSNMRADITVNENVAFGLEFRHRSSFDWRKGDHENFFLDVTRPIHELLRSSLSDRRNTFLTKLQLRITPKISLNFQSHVGWGRKHEPSYNEEKIELLTILACRWRLKLALTRMPNDVRFDWDISLVK